MLFAVACLCLSQHKPEPPKDRPEETNYVRAKALIQQFQTDVAGLKERSVADFSGKHWTNSYGVDLTMTAENLRANFMALYENDLKQELSDLEKAHASVKNSSDSRKAFAHATFDIVRAACRDDYRAIGRYVGVDYSDYSPNYNTMQGWIAVQSADNHREYETLKDQWFQSIEPAKQLFGADLDAFMAQQKAAMLAKETAWCNSQAPQWTAMRDWVKARRKSLIITLWQWQKISENTFPEELKDSFEACIVSSFENQANAAKSPLASPTSLTYDYCVRGFAKYPTVGVAYDVPNALTTNWTDITEPRDLKVNPDSVVWQIKDAFSTPAATYRAELDSPAQIGLASIDFDARLKRRMDGLRQEAVDLNQKLVDAGKALDADEANGVAADAEADRLTKKGQEIDAKLKIVQGIVAKLKQLEGSAPAATKSWIQAEDSLTNTIASLTVAGTTGANSANAAKLQRAKRQLASVESQINQLTQGTAWGDLYVQYRTNLQEIEKASSDLNSAQVDLQARQDAINADKKKNGAIVAAVAKRQLEMGQLVDGFQPNIQAIDVTANGEPVFHAVTAVDFPSFVALNQKIGQISEIIARINAHKEVAFGDFVAAEKDSIASQASLAKLLDNQAYERYIASLVFDGWDIVRATQKGGIVGAVIELGRKSIEISIDYYKDSKRKGTDDPTIAAGSREDLINKMYNARLTDATSKLALTRTAYARLWKETAVKIPKDILINGKFGSWLYNKLDLKYRPGWDSSLSQYMPERLVGNQVLDDSEVVMERLRSQLKSLQKGYFGNFVSGANVAKFAKGLGETLLKDAFKTVVFGYFDSQKRAAWFDFVDKDARATMFYALYHTEDDLWEKALEDEDELFDEKAQMLMGLGPNSPFKVLLNKQFPYDADLKITLTLSGPAPNGDPFQLYVGGALADRTSEKAYEVIATSATREKDLSIPVVVK